MSWLAKQFVGNVDGVLLTDYQPYAVSGSVILKNNPLGASWNQVRCLPDSTAVEDVGNPSDLTISAQLEWHTGAEPRLLLYCADTENFWFVRVKQTLLELVEVAAGVETIRSTNTIAVTLVEGAQYVVSAKLGVSGLAYNIQGNGNRPTNQPPKTYTQTANMPSCTVHGFGNGPGATAEAVWSSPRAE